MKPTLTLFTTLLLAPLAALAADAPKISATTAAPDWKASGEFVMIPPACTDITHDSPNPTVYGCGLARMKDGARHLRVSVSAFMENAGR